jgi:hypothetical protein
VRQVYKREAYSPRFFVVAGAWSGLISLGWHSFFDFNLQIPANLFYFAMLIGIVTSSFGAEGRDRGRRSEVGGRREGTEGGGRREGIDGGRRSEGGGQRAEGGYRTSDIGHREVRRSEVGGKGWTE